jgi:galactokinase
VTSASQVRALFETAFGGAPDGVWSSPGRVNLIGEHTDYTGGFVMPLAIGQRAYVAARPRSDRLVRAVAAGRGTEQADLDEVGPGHPTGWLGYLAGAAWIAENEVGAGHGWDLALASGVPVGAGLSSSAAITCAALLAMNDLGAWDAPRQSLALWAQQVEHRVIGIPCGIMDQTASLRCTADHVLFMDTRSLDVTQVPWTGADVGLVLLITDSRAPHVLADGQYAERRRLCEEATTILAVPQLRDADLPTLEAHHGQLTADQAACARHVITENERVLRTRALLEDGRADLIGPLLTASHQSLRDDFKVTVPQVDTAVEAALAAGALGARMTGGGFGGCTIALVRGDEVDTVRAAVDEAFAASGFTEPEHFVAVPSEGARRDA